MATSSCAAAPYETRVVTARDQPAVHDAAADTTHLELPISAVPLDDVGRILTQVPGVTLTRLGGLGAPIWVSLRGSTAQQVSVFLDGVPLHGLAASAVDLTDLPWGDVAQLDVYRGVSPLMLGGTSLGGALAFTTRQPAHTAASVGQALGAFHTAGLDLDGAWRGPTASAYLGGHGVTSAGDFRYRSDNGTAFNPGDDVATQRRNNALLHLSTLARGSLALPGRRQLIAWAWLLQRQQGVAGLGTAQTVAAALTSQQLTANILYRGRDDLGFGGKLEAQLYALQLRERFTDTLAELAPWPSATNNTTQVLGARLFASLPSAAWGKLAVVTHGRAERYAPTDALARQPHGAVASRVLVNTGVEATLNAPWALHVIPAVSLDLAHDVRSGRDTLGRFAPPQRQNIALPTARLGIWQSPDAPWSWRANLARYGRLPAASELYGDDHYVLSNNALRPERGWNADLGATWQSPAPWQARLDVTLFGAHATDLIVFEQNPRGQARAANIGTARIVGTDIAAQITVLTGAQLNAQLTLMDARDSSATAVGARQPRLPGRPWLRATTRPQWSQAIGAHTQLTVFGEVDWQQGVYMDPANLVALPNRGMLGAGVRLGLQNKLELSATAQNLLDARAFDLAGFPLPSRAFMIALRVCREEGL